MGRQRQHQPRERCFRCRMVPGLCLCPDLRRRKIETRVVVLMHYLEWLKSTNSGRLAFFSLAPCEIQMRGLKEHRIETSRLFETDREPLLLYPYGNATVLDSHFPKGKYTLVVPDGNWKQASKVGRRERGLDQMRRVKLAPGPKTRYRLRTGPLPEGVATFEAIARALGVLEGPEVQSYLENIFEMMVERILWSRGKMKPGECTRPFPPEALRGKSRIPWESTHSVCQVASVPL